MRFNKIKIENFGPFKLPVSIDFKSRDGVSIIWGGNGRGKTTILNAFNFVLNGQLKERDRKINDFISFINEDGMAEGKYSYKVSLEMEDAGNKYRIVRTLCKIPGVDIPKSNSDFYVSLTVNENGNILSTADAVIVSKSGNKDVALAKKKVEFAENVAAIFREGIDVYRDKLSKDVERDATEIFLAMNTEDDYAGFPVFIT